MRKILVIGSSNTDFITNVKHFPQPGETIVGKDFYQVMGGKGANQAVAVHKLGGITKFITCLGDDTNGRNFLKYYNEIGLDVSYSLIKKNISSGTAMITVDENGENHIVITPGANNMLSTEYIKKVENVIKSCDIILLQMEIPYETVSLACEIAYSYNKIVMLNVAPARVLDSVILKMIDYLIVNEVEAEMISGIEYDGTNKEEIIDKLLSLGASTVILTLGKEGSIIKNNSINRFIPAYNVKVIDTTGAGDTFCGAFAAELSKGCNLDEALHFATAAAAICVTRMGAQPSIPSEKEVRDFMKNNNLN